MLFVIPLSLWQFYLRNSSVQNLFEIVNRAYADHAVIKRKSLGPLVRGQRAMPFSFEEVPCQKDDNLFGPEGELTALT